jgi:hypothetical protein
VVHNSKEALEHAKNVTGVDDGVFAERFLAGIVQFFLIAQYQLRIC